VTFLQRHRVATTALPLIILAAGLSIYLTKGDSGPHNESTADAKSAIARLPYNIRFSEPRPELLVGRVYAVNESFDFLLYVNAGSATKIGRPGFEGGSLTEGYAMFSPVHIAGESLGQEARRVSIESQIEEALCRQATNEPCPF
jgi:hypothetical protein